MKPNAQVTVTSVTQSANEVLGMKEKKLYYLIIETSTGKTQINVGEKTHDKVAELTNPTQLTAPPEQQEKPKGGNK